MIRLAKSGYQSKSIGSDIALGTLDGFVSSMWAYAFATILFAGALSVFVPAGVFVVLVGWALMSLLVTLTSKLKTHMVTIDEQAVVVIGGIGSLIALQMGDRAASSAGLATMLAIMSLTSFIVAFCYFLVGKLRLNRILELVPYPVVCGFMAGIAWLILDAGFVVATDSSISPDLIDALGEGQNLLRLVLCLVAGGLLLWFANRIEAAWALPLASVIVVVLFYAVTFGLGESKDSLLASGWLFDIQSTDSNVFDALGQLSFQDVDIDLIISVLPQIFTIVFLLMLSAVMALSVVSSVKMEEGMDASDELINMSAGNVLCGLVGSPPGYTDEVSSIMYEELGASSRWMPIASSLTLLAVAFVGISVIGYMPKVLVGAIVFLFAIEMINEWMFANIRKFGFVDILIVLTILIVVIAIGFVEGILIGVFLAGFMFVFRYSRISSIHGQYSLEDHRSSVERSASNNIVLANHGGEVIVFDLRGYLFFGTANVVRDTILDYVQDHAPQTVLLDLRRVTGVDISAMQIFKQIKQFCDGKDITICYSNCPKKNIDSMQHPDVVSHQNDIPLMFDTADNAIEYVEAALLERYSTKGAAQTVTDHLMYLLQDEAKTRAIVDAMSLRECPAGEYLFKQGDNGSGFFMVQSGTLSALINAGEDKHIRVKKFSAGSLIGELSLYMSDQMRTASVIADTDSVLYYFDFSSLTQEDQQDKDIQIAIHELVARTLAGRISYMNLRLLKEMT